MTEKKWPETWQEVNPGCMVFRPGSAKEYHTGSWRAKRPIWDNAKCIKCGVCYIYCPEGCVTENADGFLRRTWTTARAAESAPMSAGRSPSKW